MLQRARALVLPSICYEGQPRTILEAFAAGVPVIASRMGGLPELVVDGTSGRLVGPEDGDGWRAAVEQLSDDAQAEQLGAGALRLWHERYSPSVAIDRAGACVRRTRSRERNRSTDFSTNHRDTSRLQTRVTRRRYVAVALHRVLGDHNRGRFGILLYHRVVPHRRESAPPDTVSPGRLPRNSRVSSNATFVRVPGRRCRRIGTRRAIAATHRRRHLRRRLRQRARARLSRACRLAYPGDGIRRHFVHGWADPPVRPVGQAGSGRRDRRSLGGRSTGPLVRSSTLRASSISEDHTHTHADFRGRPETRSSTNYTRRSNRYTSSWGHGPRAFAFPFGTPRICEPRARTYCQRAGVTCALTTEIELADPRGDRYAWGRVEAVESDSAAVCASKLTGWYNWMGVTRRAFQRVSPR